MRLDAMKKTVKKEMKNLTLQRKPPKRLPKKINARTMDIILVLIAIVFLAFTIEMIRLFRETSMIPDTLVTCVFATLGGECGAMAWIKTTKERNKDREWSVEDQLHAEKREDKAKEQEVRYGTQWNDQ